MAGNPKKRENLLLHKVKPTIYILIRCVIQNGKTLSLAINIKAEELQFPIIFQSKPEKVGTPLLPMPPKGLSHESTLHLEDFRRKTLQCQGQAEFSSRKHGSFQQSYATTEVAPYWAKRCVSLYKCQGCGKQGLVNRLEDPKRVELIGENQVKQSHQSSQDFLSLSLNNKILYRIICEAKILIFQMEVSFEKSGLHFILRQAKLRRQICVRKHHNQA